MGLGLQRAGMENPGVASKASLFAKTETGRTNFHTSHQILHTSVFSSIHLNLLYFTRI